MQKRNYSPIVLIIVFLFVQLVCVYPQSTKPQNVDAHSIEVGIDTIRTDKLMKSAPVVPFKQDTLFVIYGNLGVSTAQQRAEFIEKNIRKLEGEVTFSPDSMKIVVDDNNLLIMYEDLIVMGVTEQQAKSLNLSKEKVAQQFRGIIIDAVKQQRENNIWWVLFKQIGLSILILGITFLLIKYLSKLFKWLIVYIEQKEEKTIKTISTLIAPDKQISILSFVIKIVRFIVIAIVLYFSFTTFFSIFPQTRGISFLLLEYTMRPLTLAWNSFVDFLPDLISIIVIIVVFRLIFKFLRNIALRVKMGSIAIKGFYKDWAMPTYSIVRVVLFVLMLIFIFSHLPFADNKAFQGISVFLGILFSLGSTSIISNIVSGLVITYMRPFKIGDRIKMGEYLGNVVEKTPLVTRIKTPKNELITIPNGTIMNAQTINYTESANDYGLVLYTTVTMGYDTPWPKIHELLIEAGLQTPSVLQDPKPFVLQLALDDFYCSYQINVYTKEANQMSRIYSDLNKNIQDVFNREGLELLSPHYRAQRDGSDITIPKTENKTGVFRTNPFSVQVKKENL